jgi:hypothetical protein
VFVRATRRQVCRHHTEGAAVALRSYACSSLAQARTASRARSSSFSRSAYATRPASISAASPRSVPAACTSHGAWVSAASSSRPESPIN